MNKPEMLTRIAACCIITLLVVSATGVARDIELMEENSTSVVKDESGMIPVATVLVAALGAEDQAPAACNGGTCVTFPIIGGVTVVVTRTCPSSGGPTCTQGTECACTCMTLMTDGGASIVAVNQCLRRSDP